MQNKKYTSLSHSVIPEKANWILNLILFAFILIILRLWHLAVIQHDHKVEEARRPQRRTLIQPARRATIVDRFQLPLAINKVRYRASILYSQIRQIPATAWLQDPSGNRIKIPKRKEHINALSKLLADELQLDAERVEDLIHSKAAMYYNLPYTIKDDLSEKEYYRLRMLEKDWLGLHVESLPKRTYPMGRVASDVVGYMGAINRQEYETIASELGELEQYLEQVDRGNDPELPISIASPTEARKRLRELRERAYTINDSVGKAGIEAQFDEELRGFQGRKNYYSDAKGTFLRELPDGLDPLPGKQITLTLSAELQAYAEELLIQNESVRQAYISKSDVPGGILSKQPWIKGGAIVAIDPNTGELLALASYPRFDPNDFVASGNSDEAQKKRSNITRWLENDEYIGQIWDQRRPLERERFHMKEQEPYDETVMVSWQNYLNIILPQESPVMKGIQRLQTVENALLLQEAFQTLLLASGQEDPYLLLEILYENEAHEPYGKKAPFPVRQGIQSAIQNNQEEVMRQKRVLDRFFIDIPFHYDKVLLVDLCRLAVWSDPFSEAVRAQFGKQPLHTHRQMETALAQLLPFLQEQTQLLFNQHDFKTWRQENEKSFLQEKRNEEKRLLRYPKPYIDYFDQEEKRQFKLFWEQHRWSLLATLLVGEAPQNSTDPYAQYWLQWHRELADGAHQEASWRTAYASLQNLCNEHSTDLAIDYFKTGRRFQELMRPLFGRYRNLRKTNGKQIEKHLAAAFYPLYGFGYGRSYAYRQSAAQGSLFKLVTAHTALTQHSKEHYSPEDYAHLLEITDVSVKNGQETILGNHADGTAIPPIYKGGKLTKSNTKNIGKTNLLRAIESSSNIYFALLAGDFLRSPEDLATAAKSFSYGAKTGIELPGEITGRVPTDLLTNRTGLYSMAIGQHSLVVTPLQTAIMLSTIANGGNVLKPKLVEKISGMQREEESAPIGRPTHFKLQEELALAGIDFPLFIATLRQEKENSVYAPVTTQRVLAMPHPIRNILLEGMHRVVTKMKEHGLAGLRQFYHEYPEAVSNFINLQGMLVGKTSTAESMEQIDLDLNEGINKYTQIWFGGIAFDKPHRPQEFYLVKDAFGKPELVVIVYLRFGRYGKETAPVAAQMIKKWRELKESNGA